MIVEVPKQTWRWLRPAQRWRRPLLIKLAGVSVLAGVVLLVWRVPPALSPISSHRYADAVEVGTRVVLAVAAVVLVGAALDRARRRWWWWAAATLGVLVGLTAVVLLVWLAPPALYKNITPDKDRASAEATTRTGLIAGLAGLAALGSLAMTARTYRLTEQGQITDRYTKAIEQLGDDKLDIRLGGIYALERIAGDSKRDHSTVVEVLSAFVRERTDPARTEKPTVADVLNAFLTLIRDQPDRNPTPSNTNTKIKLPADVQAAISVLSRLPSRPGVSRGDLTGAHLTGADLGGATLTGADLGGATLTDANLGGATLTGAWLASATLTTAKDLAQQQLDSAQGNEKTQLPAGLQRPAHWSSDPAPPPAAGP